MEFVIERLMQKFKTGIGRRVCADPEKAYVNSYLLDHALQDMVKSHPELRGYSKLACDHGTSLARYTGGDPLYDVVQISAEGAQVVCIGKWSRLRSYDIDRATASVQHYISSCQPSGWTSDDIQAVFSVPKKQCKVLKYLRAEEIGRAHV